MKIKLHLRTHLFLLLMGLAWAGLAAYRWPAIPNSSFTVGEKLTFDVGWKSATAGHVTLHVAEKGTRKNRPAYKFILEAATNAAIDTVFKVRDRYESWTDEQSFCSVGFSKRIQEGNYIKIQDYFIDPPSGTFKGRSTRPNKSSKVDMSEGAIPSCVQDIVSAIYYVRGQTLSVGKTISISIMDGPTVFPLQITARRKESIKTIRGQTDCLVIEPLFKNDHGQFTPHPQATILIWLTDDKKHIPVKVSAALPFGLIEGTLAEATGAWHDN